MVIRSFDRTLPDRNADYRTQSRGNASGIIESNFSIESVGHVLSADTLYRRKQRFYPVHAIKVATDLERKELAAALTGD